MMYYESVKKKEHINKYISLHMNTFNDSDNYLLFRKHEWYISLYLIIPMFSI